MAEVLTPGFTDPPLQAQAVFRHVLEAVAHPGRIKRLPVDSSPAAPGSLNFATFALALTLIDFETPVWLDSGLADDQPVVDALRFHCSCPIIKLPEHANFALVGDPLSAPPLVAFHPGTPEYPDRSTTVIMQVDGLNGSRGARLSGPGIKTEAKLTIDGIAPGFWQEWSANHGRFPLGIDLVLTAGDRLVALPRSVSAMV